VGVIAAYQQPQDPADIKTDSNLKISREYSVNGQAKQTFQENDIVKITLKPVINSKAIDTEYQITDYLPAGLKVLSNLQSRDLPYDQLFRYPYEVNGQAVKFWSGKPAQEFYYYAMVISKGGFIAESPAIQGFIAQSSVNCGSSSRITIE